MADEELIERLEKLERENRRMKRLGGAALVLAATLGVIYATRPVSDTITARKFIVLDRQGRARITLSTPAYAGAVVDETDPDDPTIWISDARGQDRAILTGGGLSFADEKEKPLAAYSATPGTLKAHEFDVVDGAGNVRAGMRMDPAGEPDIAVLGPGGGVRGSMYLAKGGTAELGLYGKNGNRAVEMAVSSDGSRYIVFRQVRPKLQIPLGMGVTAGGRPNVTLSDGQGYSLQLGSTLTVAPTTGTTQQTSAASIIMFGNDKKHHVIWRAP